MTDTAKYDARRILLMMLMFIRGTLSPRKGVCCLDFRKLPGRGRGEKTDFSHWLVTPPRNLRSNPRGGPGKVFAGNIPGGQCFGGDCGAAGGETIFCGLCPHDPQRRPAIAKKVLALIFLGLLITGVGAVMAEEAAPKAPEFVPIVVDQAQFSAAMTYLNGLTFKDAAPIVGWLNDQEARAKAAWVADHAAKDGAKP